MMTTAQQLEEPPKVLIVDDEDALRQSLAFRYQSEGFVVLQATNGRQALEKCLDTFPDIILTDIRMPEMSGRQFLEELHSSCPPDRIPIIFCITGFSDLSESDAADLWVDRYFQKPFDPSLLIAASRAGLHKLRAKTELRSTMLSFMRDENYDGFVVSALVHEINNMLNVGSFSVIQLAEHLEKTIPDLRTRSAISRLESVFNRMHGMSNVLMRVIKGESVELQPLKVQRILRNIMDEARLRFSKCDITLTNEADDSTVVQAIPFCPQIVLMNLMKNGYQAQDGDESRLDLAIEVSENIVTFRVSNPGNLDDEIAHQVFNPYFSTKNTGDRGMGVGLAIAKRMVAESEGTIELTNWHGSVEFVMRLRRVQEF